MALFESYERRIDQIKPVMEKYGIKDFEDALKICTDKGFNPYEIVKGVQPICFENAAWAYTLGAAIAIKKGCTKRASSFIVLLSSAGSFQTCHRTGKRSS